MPLDALSYGCLSASQLYYVYILAWQQDLSDQAILLQHSNPHHYSLNELQKCVAKYADFSSQG